METPLISKVPLVVSAGTAGKPATSMFAVTSVTDMPWMLVRFVPAGDSSRCVTARKLLVSEPAPSTRSPGPPPSISR